MSARLAPGLLVFLLAACGASRSDLETVCAAYTEAVERLAELGDTTVVSPLVRVRADAICEGMEGE